MRSPFTPSGQDGRVGCCQPGGQPERQPVVDTHCFYCLTPFTLLVTSIQPPSWGIPCPSSPCTSDKVDSTQTPRVVPKAEARPTGAFPPQHSWFRAEHVIQVRLIIANETVLGCTRMDVCVCVCVCPQLQKRTFISTGHEAGRIQNWELHAATVRGLAKNEADTEEAGPQCRETNLIQVVASDPRTEP